MLNILQLTIFGLLLLMGVTFLMAPDAYIRWYAKFLVIEANPAPSDIVVVLAGNEGRLRWEEGFRLMEEGYGQVFILTGYEKDEKEVLRQKFSERLALPPAQVAIEDRAQSTYENAYYTSELVAASYPEAKSLILVTSPSQSRRARMIFRKFFPAHSIRVSYNDRHRYDPDLVLTDKAVRGNFTSEGMKYLYYIAKYTF